MTKFQIPRRTQAERTRASREKIIHAATELFAQQGFRGAKMADIANSPDTELALQAQMHKEIARYVEPVLQAVAVSKDDEGGPLQVTVRIVPHA